MMTFKGMNPDEGRDVATAVNEAGRQILDQVDAVTATVTSVDWIGPDYESFREDWNGFVSGAVNALVEGFQRRSEGLTTHADQQDTTSDMQ
ncbi:MULTISPECIES: hypothetical protein [unclassified Brachybacterium]|uniref:hypothetical protein n=1 Tax=unclassified Brachybacterium TaxID=2623841 RepID=UPI004033EC4D